MSSEESPPPPESEPGSESAAPTGRSRTGRFLVKGLAVTLPAILTLVILIWLCGLLNRFIVQPSTWAVRYSLALFLDDSRPKDDPKLVAWERLPALKYCGTDYLVTEATRERLTLKVAAEAERDPDEVLGPRTTVPVKWIEDDLGAVFVPTRERAVPYLDYLEAAEHVETSEMPRTANGIYREIVTARYFYGLVHLTAVVIAGAVVLLYFLGGFFTARIGSWVVHRVETGVLGRLPLISNVYSSVKQVTDFFFTERTVEYNRIVAVEYPRRGIWSIGFVTSDSLLEITAAAGEPMVTILMPTSPMPMTGFTISTPRSEIVDLNITVDQVFQFYLSCGVLIPPQQRVTPELLREELAKRLARGFGNETAAPGGNGADAHSDEPADPHAPPSSVRQIPDQP